MPSLTERLAACYSGVVYDIMRDMGLPPAVLPNTIRSLEAGVKIAGPVFTMRGRPDNSIGAHESLLEWTSFLSKAPSGHVLVCQPQDTSRALMGELSAEALKLRGVLGYLVDGGARDVSFIKKIGFPVFCSYTSPVDVVANWRPEAFDEPVTIGNIVIYPGDYILGDEDGVVVIPAAHAEEVIERCEVAVNTESLVRKAILAGEDPQTAYIKHGKF
ncbi:RraA family protein [Devosia sp. A369]